MMRAGSLRYRLILQSPPSTQSTSGAVSGAWTDGDTVWASIEPLRGQERFAAQVVQAEVSVRVRLRYRSGVTTTMRLANLAKTRFFDILAVIDPGERHQELELLCREVV